MFDGWLWYHLEEVYPSMVNMFSVETTSSQVTPWHWQWDTWPSINVSYLNQCQHNKFIFLSLDSPKNFKLLHWASFLVSLSGVVFLLLARGHYTIDVILAYYVTTRIWWSYHTLAHNKHLRSRGEDNMVANECWWYAFRWVFLGAKNIC